MIQDLLYYWKSVLLVVVAFVLGGALGATALFYLQPRDSEIIVGASVFPVEGSFMRGLTESDPLVALPLMPGSTYPLMRPVDLEESQVWVLAYNSLDFNTLKDFYDKQLKENGWSTTSVQNYEDSTVYTVKFENYSGDLTLAKTDYNRTKVAIQGILTPAP